MTSADANAGWSVYIIETDGGRLYTGITTDLERRWRAHVSGKGGAKFFRSDRPARVVLWECGYSRGEALRRERAIKALDAAAKRQIIATSTATPALARFTTHAG